MDDKQVQVGQIVRSVAGRDRDHLFVVTELINDAFIQVADGDKRKLSNPKRKNVKHVVPMASATEVSQPISDSEIKRALTVVYKEVRTLWPNKM